MVSMQKIRDYEVINFKWNIYVTPPHPQGSDIMEERVEKLQFLQLQKASGSSHGRATAHIYSKVAVTA